MKNYEIKEFINRKLLVKWRMRKFPFENYMDKYKCIFIHIPKVAGTSILDVLGKNQGGRNHLPWYVYYTANKYKFDKYFKFTFVRNPWDRAYSSYSYLFAGGNKQVDINLKNNIQAYQNFDHFVIDGLGSGSYRNHLLFLPQSEFVLGPQGDIVVDFLGYYERLEDDFYKLMSLMKINRNLPQFNESFRGKKYKNAYLIQESIDIIEQIYRQDIQFFNYNFENSST